MSVMCVDCVGGVAGNMMLAGLIDLGVEPGMIEEALAPAGLGMFKILHERRASNGIDGVWCDVEIPHEHAHRTLPDILAILDQAELPPVVRENAGRVFERLAEAEAAVHGSTTDKVHFHEVGAIDAIVDIAGTCLGLHELGVDRVLISDFKVGQGTVKAAHGVLPLPVPATTALLKGWRVQRTSESNEMTTPTGAALLTGLAEGHWQEQTGALREIGVGLGTRTHEALPNVVRLFLCEAPCDGDTVLSISADIDDASPEALAFVTDKLREVGALDVVQLPVMMKKGRIGTRVETLVTHGCELAILKVLFDETTTLGVRKTLVTRQKLSRDAVEVETAWGTLSAKRVVRPQGVEVVPEADACKALSETSGVSWRRLMSAGHYWE